MRTVISVAAICLALVAACASTSPFQTRAAGVQGGGCRPYYQVSFPNTGTMSRFACSNTPESVTLQTSENPAVSVTFTGGKHYKFDGGLNAQPRYETHNPASCAPSGACPSTAFAPLLKVEFSKPVSDVKVWTGPVWTFCGDYDQLPLTITDNIGNVVTDYTWPAALNGSGITSFTVTADTSSTGGKWGFHILTVTFYGDDIPCNCPAIPPRSNRPPQ